MINVRERKKNIDRFVNYEKCVDTQTLKRLCVFCSSNIDGASVRAV